MQLGIGIIVAGTLIRTRQTASIISGVLGNIPVETEPLINERFLGEWNAKPVAETEAQLAAKMTPPGGESEEQFEKRISRALDRLRPYYDRRPLLVSSKGVGRILNQLLIGEGRMQVGNGEVVEFAAAHDPTGHFKVHVSRPHQV